VKGQGEEISGLSFIHQTNNNGGNTPLPRSKNNTHHHDGAMGRVAQLSCKAPIDEASRTMLNRVCLLITNSIAKLRHVNVDNMVRLFNNPHSYPPVRIRAWR
jgi:hypothetical protein